MTIEELEELRQKAQKVKDCKIVLTLCTSGRWDMNCSKSEPNMYEVSRDAMLSRLRAMATPPKPANVTVTVPYDVAEHYAKHIGDVPKCGVFMGRACAEAIAPYEPPK